MLYGLEQGLQKRFECHGAYEMFQDLKLVFQTHAHVERHETSDKYFAYKMEEMLGNAVFQKIYLRSRKIYLGDA